MIIVDNKEQCTGCGACYNICPSNCISMKEDNEGFFYPNIDSKKCINCLMCKSVCPVINAYDEDLIAFPETYLVWANEKNLREEATSGGLFSAVASDILKCGGIVYGAAYDDENVVRHIKIEHIEQLKLINRSKYVQSSTGETFKSVCDELKSKRTVLYSGTACQIYGLLSYLKKKKVNTELLYTIDVVCHGAPSPKLLREYLKWQENHEQSKVDSIAMREKIHPKIYYSEPTTKVIFKNGKKVQKAAGDDYYGRFFWGEISSRPSCYNCTYKTIGRISDLTIGDCWFSKALTGKKDVPFDVTLCLVQSEKGKKLINDSKSITSIKVDEEKAIKCNGGMIYSSAIPHPKREEFFSQLGTEQLGNLAEKYFPSKTAKKGILKKIKEYIKKIPGIYSFYYFNQKRNEFANRCKRKIPQDSLKNRRI
ncbi:MAG: Coenzyme F420 hydrogenase/dehydrogenase, beta subunit C-terminal domain [Candidatus Gastranaerophilaceae bacterium]